MSRLYLKKYVSKNKMSKSFGKTYARLQAVDTLNIDDLCRHIQKHGSVFTAAEVKGVTEKFVACIGELLLEGYKVKLDGLGTFYLMAENKKGGAVSLDKFNPKTSFSGLHIRFLPDASSESQLNSKDILAKATFMWAEDLKRESAAGKPAPTTGGNSGSSTDDGESTGPGGGEG